MSAPLIFLAIDIATVLCALIIGARMVTGAPRQRSAQLIAVIAFDTACGAVLSHQEYGPWMPPAFRIDVDGWAPLLNLARNLTPGLIMVLCHGLFTDRRRFPRWLLVLLAVQLLLEEPGRSLVPGGWPLARLTTQTVPALLQTLFVGLALYWTLADWRGDLVERRRRTRAFTVTVIGLTTIASVLLTRVLIDPDNIANYFAHEALNGCDVAIMLVVLFQLTDGDIRRHIDFSPVARIATSPPPTANGERQSALARLMALLEDENICQQPGLTLKALADRVGLPEYRLRRLIHEELGYQNFNALLHDYRVKAACVQLRDPKMRRTPILTIALSVGYSSVNTFNRGFREIMNVTPSAYRSQDVTGDPAAKGAPESE